MGRDPTKSTGDQTVGPHRVYVTYDTLEGDNLNDAILEGAELDGSDIMNSMNDQALIFWINLIDQMAF